MGRKRKPPEEYLRKALDVFWQYGYEGTSITDLTEYLGIGAQSIYNKFGNKQGLYFATVNFFLMLSHHTQELSLEADDAALPEIVLYFALQRKLELDSNKRMSHFLAHAALEMAPHNEELKQMVHTYFVELKDAFRQAVVNAQDKREITNRDADAVAWYLVNALNSFGILRKAGISLVAIDQIMIMTLSILDGFTEELFYQQVDRVDQMNLDYMK